MKHIITSITVVIALAMVCFPAIAVLIWGDDSDPTAYALLSIGLFVVSTKKTKPKSLVDALGLGEPSTQELWETYVKATLLLISVALAVKVVF